MKNPIGRVRMFLRDLGLHFGPAILCLLARRHRDPASVGKLSKPGFRAVDLYQCRKCYAFTMSPKDAAKLGGK